MKFEILTENFERRKERTPYGTIPLRRISDRRDFFLNENAAALLELPAGVHIFEECFEGLDETLLRDLRDGLTLMAAFDAAAIDFEEDKPVCTFAVAGERDYYDISALINNENAIRFGTFPNPQDMTMDAMRGRQFNNIEYHFLYREQGTLKGVLIVGLPSEESYSTAVRIIGIVLSGDVCTSAIPEDPAAEPILRGLITYAENAFHNDMGIMRYLCYDSDDPILPLLLKMGYQETAFLRHETLNGNDVRIYDKRITLC